MNEQPSSSPSSDIDPQLAGLLAYLVPPITGIIFFLIEKEREVVRWHAAQSIAFGAVWIVLWVVFVVLSTILSAAVPIIGWIISTVIWLGLAVGGFVLWIMCLIKGYSGKMWRMPVVAGFADKVYAPGDSTAST